MLGLRNASGFRRPSHLATHSTAQTLYFGEDGLIRRHDYDVEIIAGNKGAHRFPSIILLSVTVPPRKACLVLHGKAAMREDVRRAVHAAREDGSPVDVRVTWEGDDASRFALEAAQAGYEIVVAGGGDGTVNAVVAGLIEGSAASSASPSLAVLPLGTANDLARACGIPLDPFAPASRGKGLSSSSPSGTDARRVEVTSCVRRPCSMTACSTSASCHSFQRRRSRRPCGSCCVTDSKESAARSSAHACPGSRSRLRRASRSTSTVSR